jgi:hypothetical protein
MFASGFLMSGGFAAGRHRPSGFSDRCQLLIEFARCHGFDERIDHAWELVDRWYRDSGFAFLEFDWLGAAAEHQQAGPGLVDLPPRHDPLLLIDELLLAVLHHPFLHGANMSRICQEELLLLKPGDHLVAALKCLVNENGIKDATSLSACIQKWDAVLRSEGSGRS